MRQRASSNSFIMVNMRHLRNFNSSLPCFVAVAMVLIAVVIGCKWGTSTLKMEKVGFEITFPCKKYESPQPASFVCIDPNREEYHVRFESISVPKYETRKSIYEGFVKNAANDSTKKGAINERTVNGSRILEYTEDEFENDDQLIKRTRYVDVFKDNNLFEISGMCRRDFKNKSDDLNARIKSNLDPFIDSMVLRENK